jgi:hypothetical protein
MSINGMGHRAGVRHAIDFGGLGHDDDDVPRFGSGQVGQIIDRVVGPQLNWLESDVFLAEDDANQHWWAAAKRVEAP